jgi:hypothetical protein
MDYKIYHKDIEFVNNLNGSVSKLVLKKLLK